MFADSENGAEGRSRDEKVEKFSNVRDGQGHRAQGKDQQKGKRFMNGLKTFSGINADDRADKIGGQEKQGGGREKV